MKRATNIRLAGPPIVFEDADILVVNKPPGLLTSTGPREKRKTLLAMVEAYVAARDPRARVGLIHRLDRDASGLLVFTKNHTAYRSLKQQFFDHTVDRVYAAVVHGTPNPREGRIESFLIERADGTVHSVRKSTAGAEHAVSAYTTLESKNGLSLVQVRLETGRKHQIRVHLGAKGNSIVGDRMYGQKTRSAGQLMLIATELAFDHPSQGKRVSFRVPLPRRMRALALP